MPIRKLLLLWHRQALTDTFFHSVFVTFVFPTWARVPLCNTNHRLVTDSSWSMAWLSSYVIDSHECDNDHHLKRGSGTLSLFYCSH